MNVYVYNLSSPKRGSYPQILPSLVITELWHNDIALLRLEEPVPVSATHIPEIQAAKLPKQGETRFPMDGQNCIMKGWGCTMNGTKQIEV